MHAKILWVSVFSLLWALCAQAQVPQELVGTWQTSGLELTINADGTYVWKDQVQTLKGTVKVQQSLISLEYQGNLTPYMWAVEGNQLRLTGPKGGVVVLTKAGSGSAGSSAPVSRDQIVGRWRSERFQVTLDLKSDGTYTFASDHGRWQVQKDFLLLVSDSGSKTLYRFRIHQGNLQLMDKNGNVMTLSPAGGSPSWGGGATSGSGGGFLGGTQQASADYIGTWAQGNLVLQLNPDGTYKFATVSGNYQVNGSTLLLYYQGKPTAYQFVVKGNQLLLVDPAGNKMLFQKR